MIEHYVVPRPEMYHLTKQLGDDSVMHNRLCLLLQTHPVRSTKRKLINHLNVTCIAVTAMYRKAQKKST